MRAAFAAFALVLLSGCTENRSFVAPLGSVEKREDAALARNLSRVSAEVLAASEANAGNPEGAPKQATEGALSVARAGLPAPDADDAQEASSRVRRALAGDLDIVTREWRAEAETARSLRAELAKLREQAERERADSANRVAEAIRRANDEAERKTQRIIGIVFYGGGACCAFAGVLCLTTLSSIPWVGRRMAFGLIAAGFGAIACGRVVSYIFARPWIAFAVVGIPILVSVTLAYANRFWHRSNAETS